MQTYLEPIFNVAYLIVVMTLGIIILSKNTEYRLFGLLAVILDAGDSFHLIPRIYSTLTGTFNENYVSLGFGKLVTSITMTAFYVLLYHFWRRRYKITNKKSLTYIIYILAAIRVALCFFPQNRWMSQNPSYLWGIYRNIPFLIMGIIIAVIFYKQPRKHNDVFFKNAWLAISLSFAFYLIVVVFASTVSILGMLMIPKTLCYVWLVVMGYRAFRKDLETA